MKTVSLCDLGGQDLFFGRPEVFAESWVSRKAFGQYRDRSRPVSALFMVCTDIKVHFFGQERAALTAVQGDVIFIPKGVRYHVQVEGGTPNRIDTYTVNLDLKGETGEDVLLSESISRLCNDREGALQPHFQKLNEAAHNGDPGSLLRIKSELYLLLDALSATVAASPAAPRRVESKQEDRGIRGALRYQQHLFLPLLSGVVRQKPGRIPQCPAPFPCREYAPPHRYADR